MNRVKRYLLLTYIFCLSVGMNAVINPHPAVTETRNFQTIITLGFFESLFLALFLFPIAFIVAKFIDKRQGNVASKTKLKPSKLKNYNDLWD
jgi:hypothetical protein